MGPVSNGVEAKGYGARVTLIRRGNKEQYVTAVRQGTAGRGGRETEGGGDGDKGREEERVSSRGNSSVWQQHNGPPWPRCLPSQARAVTHFLITLSPSHTPFVAGNTSPATPAPP